jgi:hypothetical protein
VSACDDVTSFPPRELAKELLRHDAFRDWITDPAVPLGEVVKAIRHGRRQLASDAQKHPNRNTLAARGAA